MDKEKILDNLKQSAGVQDLKEIEYKQGYLVLQFFYEYDNDEIEAAKAYANNETNSEDSEDVWYDEYYIPYLIDIAVDEVSESLEDMVEKMDLNAQYVNYELERDDESCEFVAVFAENDVEFDIEDVLNEIGM
jgi:hypothetical protein